MIDYTAPLPPVRRRRRAGMALAWIALGAVGLSGGWLVGMLTNATPRGVAPPASLYAPHTFTPVTVAATPETTPRTPAARATSRTAKATPAPTVIFLTVSAKPEPTRTTEPPCTTSSSASPSTSPSGSAEPSATSTSSAPISQRSVYTRKGCAQ